MNRLDNIAQIIAIAGFVCTDRTHQPLHDRPSTQESASLNYTRDRTIRAAIALKSIINMTSLQ
ncbi:MAG: hypothetical protein LH660_19490 [Phormidesmis sp. CAN_BIN36]|nr:hypothetical protein [Phormidesmis sp. CAN_BIN36]